MMYGNRRRDNVIAKPKLFLREMCTLHKCKIILHDDDESL